MTAVLGGCAADSADDDLDGAIDLTGKADAASLAGNYQLTGGGARKGDLVDLALGADGSYVRLRCYTTNCSATTPESDQYRVVEVPSTHKQYLVFERFTWADAGKVDTKQVTVDSYEIRKTGANLELRKAYTSSWFSLEPRTDEAMCTGSGGTWDAQTEFDGAAAGTTTHCNCGQDPTLWPSPAFVPGAGGCRMAFAIGEDACDTTDGAYTDDDRDALGDYCRCTAGTRPTDDGCVSL